MLPVVEKERPVTKGYTLHQHVDDIGQLRIGENADLLVVRTVEEARKVRRGLEEELKLTISDKT